VARALVAFHLTLCGVIDRIGVEEAAVRRSSLVVTVVPR
jgi:hypothetical protein